MQERHFTATCRLEPTPFRWRAATRDFNQGQTLQLASGMQADLEVQVLTDFGSWGCFDPNTWYIRQIAPERAQYLF